MHREDFESRLAGLTRSDAYSVSRQDVIEDQKRRWIFHVHREPPLVEWGALIGECVFNFRSALDHLAFDLAVAHTGYPLPQGVEEKMRVPDLLAASTEDSGARRPNWRCPSRGSASHRADAAVRSKGSSRAQVPRRSPQLRQASNAASGRRAKHRGCLLRRPARLRGLRQSRPAERWRPSRSDSTERRARPRPNPNFHFGVAFSQTGPGAKAPDVETTLRWIGQHIERGVIEPLRPFLQR
jgi:hypothetical protein